MSFRSSGRTRIPFQGKDGKQHGQTKESKCEDFDDILDIVGGQGKFQKFFLYAILSPITSVEPLFILNVIFMLFEPDHFCHVPGRPVGVDIETWKNMTLPWEKGADGQMKLSKCSMYNSTDQVFDYGDENYTRPTSSCLFGWDYDKTDYESTIPSEFNWVCEKSEYATNALTLAAAGNAVGTVLFGQLADKFGRKKIFFITCAINLLFRIISLFIAQYYVVFLIFQFIIGTAFPVMYIAPTLIAAEMSDKEYRAWIYSFGWMIWVFGMASLPLLAWLSRSWFYMGLATSVPGLLILFYWKWIPESPRWLISRGRIGEASKVIQKIQETNGTVDKLSPGQLDSMIKQLIIKQDECDKNTGVWTLFSRPRLTFHTILITLSWSMNNLIYYGITLNATNLSGNQFVNFFILAIIEVPAGYLGGVLSDKIGRRWTQVLFFLCCMFTCFGAGVGALNPNLSYIVIIFIVIAKFAVTLTFLVVYMQAAELYPTQLRSTGSGFSSTVACAASIGGPYMIYLGKLNVAAPYVLLGAMSVLGAFVSIWLPETLNQSLPETVEDANSFGKNHKFWSFCPDGDDDKKRSTNGDIKF